MRIIDASVAQKEITSSYMNRVEEKLTQYRSEVKQELDDVLAWWLKFAIDNANGGFIGRIDHKNQSYPEAPKGLVLNSRILWSFSSAHELTGKSEYLDTAYRSFDYINENFIDREFGGAYWTVDFKGNPLDEKKQIYAQAFAVYGLSEFYKTSGNDAAKELALKLYQEIVTYSCDQEHGGYIEALTRDWKESSELRLSSKDANERKSMNTHLHLLEAFTNLYQAWPATELKEKIRELIYIFLDHIISKETGRLNLFFDDEWNSKCKLISYGHDIEAAWLLTEAAEVIDDKILLQKVNNRSLLLTNAAAKGLDGDGGLWYEYDVERRKLIKQKHSWPQAEAMVGFFHAWQISGTEKYLEQSLGSWHFVQEHIKDNILGEWKWGVNEDYSTMDNEDKVGIWKCPYHNSRACIEIIKRVEALIG